VYQFRLNEFEQSPILPKLPIAFFNFDLAIREVRPLLEMTDCGLPFRDANPKCKVRIPK
jgi:hypothetical protein